MDQYDLQQDVVIRGCFMRQRDDAVVIKADSGNLDLFSAYSESLKELPGEQSAMCWLKTVRSGRIGATASASPMKSVCWCRTLFSVTTMSCMQPTKLGVLPLCRTKKRFPMCYSRHPGERCLKPLISLDILQTKWSVSDVMGSIRNVVFRDITLVEHNQVVQASIKRRRRTVV